MKVKRILNLHKEDIKNRIRVIGLSEIEKMDVYENMIVTRIRYQVRSTPVEEICKSIINDIYRPEVDMRIMYQIREGVIFRRGQEKYIIKLISVVR